MKTHALHQRAARRAPLTLSPSPRPKIQVATDLMPRDADECLVGRFSTRLPRAAPRQG